MFILLYSMEHPTLLPRDEQYPLLKVDGGAGDSVTRTQPTPSIVSSRWNVTCANGTKQSWCSRWPGSKVLLHTHNLLV